MTPVFTDPAARLRWDAYFADVRRSLARAGAHAAGLRGDRKRMSQTAWRLLRAAAN